MRIYTFLYWLRNLFGVALVGFGLWMIFFFKPSESPNLILREHNTLIGFSTFPLGALFIAGLENIIRIAVGIAICFAGLLAMAYFIHHRDTWMGQLITNFIAPAAIIGGVLVMLLFDNKPKSRYKR
ncbi:MAG: hypothetical protein SFU25_08040 [Candidatus Caenarcaniphilales bacterium]|nr:hypothetical protein [Candidatus Caenarcaniphilales bacterium]